MIQLIQQSELANHASPKLLKLLNHFTARPTLFTKKRTAATVW
jgi:hypothetical protein